MKNKVIELEQVAQLVKEGDVVMYGGFLGVGTPESIVDWATSYLQIM